MKLEFPPELPTDVESPCMKLTSLILMIFFAFLGSRNVAGQNTAAQAAPAATQGPAQTASIYVTASTKKGVLIRDLKPEDITVMEDNAPAKIEQVVCRELGPLLIGILADVSGSRGSDSHLHSHYDDLEAFLNKLLTKDDGTYVVAYGDEVRKLSEVVTDSPGISAAFDKLRKQRLIGSTALYDAIKAAANANFKGRAGRRVLLVMGDWEDNSSRARIEDAVQAAQRTSTTVYAILDSDNGEESKKSHNRAQKAATEITGQTGGRAYEFHDKNDLVKILQAIGEAVLGVCKVTYTSSENPDKKKGVELHVQANAKDVSVFYPRVRFSTAP